MKYLILLSLACLICACTVEEREEKVPNKYPQQTFEVVGGKLVNAEDDWVVKKITGGWDYRNKKEMTFQLSKIQSPKDTIFFQKSYFRIDKINNNTGFTTTHVIINKDTSLSYDICIIGGVSGGDYVLSRLPSHIDNSEQNKNWSIIFPYTVQNKEKCLIFYDLDSILVKPTGNLTQEPT